MKRDAGFSVVELAIALALTLVVCAVAFSAIDPAGGLFSTQPEAADLQQRLRLAEHTLSAAIGAAGANADVGGDPLPLAGVLAAALPYRLGPLNPDPPGTFRSNALTVVSVPARAVQTRITRAIHGQLAEVGVELVAGCPMIAAARDPACGFAAGHAVLVWDDSRSFDLFTVADVSGGTLTLQHARGALVHPYEAGSRIVAVDTPTYYSKGDAATGAYQLMRYNGRSSDAPLVDHVVDLGFDYFGVPVAGDPRPQVSIDPDEFVDGPWLPDDTNVNRFDADLRRIRRIAVRVRVEAASDALRGPAGILFTRAGTARRGMHQVPDVELSFDVAPRNMELP